ncbi:MAG: FAD-dependent oxidoreductase [Gemmatimonadetes bacterium]|nr:FAD-dependent oxidoreductase [Gemmatimonadota bacterium]
MGDGSELKGPDLRAGIDASTLGEGAMLLGHADGKQILLARANGEVFAIGARCSHYGGPLVKGIIVGDTVRCPWHHASFSLRTGEAQRPPALKDVACWSVVEEDDRIRVTGRRQPRIERTPRASPASVVILGAGAAGNAAAETLRREGYQGPIAMIDMEPDSPYDRPNLSKDYLAGKAPEEWIPLHSPEFYRERGIEIVRLEAVAIDPATRSVTLADGSTRIWNALLLAPGAEPIRLNLAVESGAVVHTLRSLADSRVIIAGAKEGGHAVVLGASFIGLETAASLTRRGMRVTIVAPEERPLGRIMGAALGDFVRALHEAQGVTFRLGHVAKEVRRNHVVLDDGTRIDADIVVAGIGVRPRVALAQAAGVGIDDGILVNEYLETSIPGIWAAGDAARWPDPRSGERVRVEHWVVAQRMGQVAARNMLGARERFDAVPFFWSRHYDVSIAYVGNGTGWDAADVDGDPAQKDCAVTFRRAGRRVALATIFRNQLSLRTEAEMERDVSR